MTRATKHLAQVDPIMAGLIERFGLIRMKPRRLPPFQSLVQAIVFQQLSGKAAETILGRFRALFGDGPFPLPEQVIEAEPERLRSAGLSRPKASYIRGIAAHSVAGSLPGLAECDPLADAVIMDRLTQIKGVGRWTAEMFLMFNLGRPDVLPVHDLGVRKGFQRAYAKRKPPTPEQLDRFGERWKPFRTTAARYLWRAADTTVAL